MTQLKKKRFYSATIYPIIGWCLFDFANSIPLVIGGIYFSKWFVNDLKAGSIMLNMMFITSALCVLFFGRILGKKIDKEGYKKWIVISSVIMLLSLTFIYVFSQLKSLFDITYLAFFLFTLFIVGFQTSKICHNTYLKKLIPQAYQNKVSGLGAASNWLGSIFGILITLPVINKLSGAEGREATFLLAAITYCLFTVFALYLMFQIKNRESFNYLKIELKVKNPLSQLFPTITLQVFTFFLLFDVMNTVEKNLPNYLTSAWSMADQQQAYGYLIILLSASIGGFFSFRFVNDSNSLRWLKTGSIILSFAILFLLLSKPYFLWSSFVLAGFAYGLLESAIRINFMSRFEEKIAGERFAVLAIAERFSGIIGPLIWIIPFAVSNDSVWSYNTSMILMSILSISAFTFLSMRNFQIDRPVK
jgi:MFS-type transporter involved in bile tolerance (Atg22 family)